MNKMSVANAALPTALVITGVLTLCAALYIGVYDLRDFGWIFASLLHILGGLYLRAHITRHAEEKTLAPGQAKSDRFFIT